MEKYHFADNIKTFGITVATFPVNIGKAFEELIQKTGDAAGRRDYYGIAEFKEGRMFYYAVAAEKYDGESEKYNYEKFTIEKGDYLTEALPGWQKKTNCIKDIFADLLKDDSVNKEKPAIEWYKNDDEMLCMVMIKNNL